MWSLRTLFITSITWSLFVGLRPSPAACLVTLITFRSTCSARHVKAFIIPTCVCVCVHARTHAYSPWSPAFENWTGMLNFYMEGRLLVFLLLDIFNYCSSRELLFMTQTDLCLFKKLKFLCWDFGHWSFRAIPDIIFSTYLLRTSMLLWLLCMVFVVWSCKFGWSCLLKFPCVHVKPELVWWILCTFYYSVNRHSLEIFCFWYCFWMGKQSALQRWVRVGVVHKAVWMAI